MPLASIFFGHAALVAFLSLEVLFVLPGAGLLGGLEDLGGGVLEKRLAGQGRGDAFPKDKDDLELALVGPIMGGDLEVVAGVDGRGWLQGGGATLDLSSGAFLGGEAPGLVEADGPEPLVETHGVGHDREALGDYGVTGRSAAIHARMPPSRW